MRLACCVFLSFGRLVGERAEGLGFSCDQASLMSVWRYVATASSA